ncbi:wall-associated receptor kinase [Salix suchowensis]|nr:wall-associated receptor kinase [Salix suchowensis]
MWVFLLMMLLLLWPVAASTARSVAKPGCQEKCGNVSVPYPFGIFEPSCAMNDYFFLNCSSNDEGHPELFFMENAPISNIELEGTVTVGIDAAFSCYDKTGIRTHSFSQHMNLGSARPFMFSNTRNIFTAIGCDTSAQVTNFEFTYGAACLSLCTEHVEMSDENPCSGSGCCQTSIPKGLISFNYSVSSAYYNYRNVSDFNLCGFAFLADNRSLKLSNWPLSRKPKYGKDAYATDVVIEWVVENKTCEQAKADARAYACGANANCSTEIDQGYRCSCNEGFEGNPYLKEGCLDIDECKGENPCQEGTCKNTIGDYKCRCPLGKYGDGKTKCTGVDKDECKVEGKKPCQEGTCENTIGNYKCRCPIGKYGDGKIGCKGGGIITGVGVGFGALFLFIGLWLVYKVFKRKRDEKLKKSYFKRNGGLLLQEQLSSGEVNVEKIRMFPSKELDKATDHYNANRTLGQGGQGTVYKGMLADGKIVAVKKSKVIDEGNLRQFINEVVLLSQINHRNVVKLLGCCLETELPLLVYEFIPNGTLFQFLHDPIEEFPLTWEMRLRIAAEVAGALFYLHSAASIAIFHRDIKSTNILLDEKYRAKVADFGTSRSVSVDQTHVTTQVQGTFGYLDPEYFQSSQFTDKSDVYSFGVVLVELLTGQKAISFTRSEEQGRSLATYFLMVMESNCLFDILDPQVGKEGKKEDVVMVASLARSCLRLNGKERPTMKEVTMVLERIQKSDNLIVQQEIEYDRNEVIGTPWDATSPSTISSFGISASSSLDEKPLLHTY